MPPADHERGFTDFHSTHSTNNYIKRPHFKHVPLVSMNVVTLFSVFASALRTGKITSDDDRCDGSK
jgi:hypothetical protein